MSEHRRLGWQDSALAHATLPRHDTHPDGTTAMAEAKATGQHLVCTIGGAPYLVYPGSTLRRLRARQCGAIVIPAELLREG